MHRALRLIWYLPVPVLLLIAAARWQGWVAGPVFPIGVVLMLTAGGLMGVIVVPARALRLVTQAALVAAAASRMVEEAWPVDEVVAVLVTLTVIVVIADHYARLLERARSEQARERAEVERRVALLSAVEDLPDDHDAAVAEVVRSLRALAFDAAGVSFVRDGLLVAERLEGIEDLPPLPPGQGLAWRAIDEDRTVATADYAAEPARLYEREDVGAVLVTPIRLDGRPVGVVLCSRRRAELPTRSQIETAEVLAAHLGGLLTALAREQRQAEIVSRVSRLDELRSELIAAVSAEVRDPIRAVADATTRLRREGGEPDQRDAEVELARLRAAAAELDLTVSTVLAVARRRLHDDAGEFEALPAQELVTRLQAVVPGGIESAPVPEAVLEATTLWVVPGLVAHALELLVDPTGSHRTGGLRYRLVDGDGDGNVGADDAGVLLEVMLADPPLSSPVVRSLAAQLLAAGGAALLEDRPGGSVVALRLGTVTPGRLG